MSHALMGVRNDLDAAFVFVTAVRCRPQAARWTGIPAWLSVYTCTSRPTAQEAANVAGS